MISLNYYAYHIFKRGGCGLLIGALLGLIIGKYLL